MASVSLSKFVTESEVEEAKRKRKEEWDRVRGPDDPEDAPEPDVSDRRPLFDRLEEQRLKKEAEREESRQLKNLVKGLDSDEVEFLERVDDLRAQQERQQREEERRELEEFKLRTQFARPAVEPEKVEPIKKTTNFSSEKRETKSQAKLLIGAIKRKVSDANIADSTSGTASINKSASNSQQTATESGDINSNRQQADQGQPTKTMRVLGVLPGLGNYESDSSEVDSNGSSEEELTMPVRDLLGRKLNQQ
ncbi:protein FAM192A-like [Varroa jacobsoni]|uniref:FAM192A/Fyv6 N-terminal domain-containing protein n=1 Tax=Varroa destructor TaxID=109461 RepID=A0A7M7M3Q6_VARDE|nr:protein FAM192A-like [Varroa destructor]XP_022692922.1 protein FAM192A-like [Varroa jacobsoni]